MEFDLKAFATALVLVFAVTRVIGVSLDRVFDHRISAVVTGLVGAMIIFAAKAIGDLLPFVGPEEEPIYYYMCLAFCFVFDLWKAIRK